MSKYRGRRLLVSHTPRTEFSSLEDLETAKPNAYLCYYIDSQHGEVWTIDSNMAHLFLAGDESVIVYQKLESGKWYHE